MHDMFRHRLLRGGAVPRAGDAGLRVWPEGYVRPTVGESLQAACLAVLAWERPACHEQRVCHGTCRRSTSMTDRLRSLKQEQKVLGLEWVDDFLDLFYKALFIMA